MTGTRKFFITVAGSIGAFFLCWVGKLQGHDWLIFQSIVLGVHHAANVVDKKLGGAG